MTLNILSSIDERVFDGETLTLPTSYLNQNATHLFIASNKWNRLYVELNDNIPLNVLKYVATRSEKINVKLPEQVTNHTISLMCELYPDKSGIIRKTYMLGKDVGSVV